MPANVLKTERQEQVRALGRLGWSLRRIQDETGVHRDTARGYLVAAGIPIRKARRRSHPGHDSKPASEATTDPGAKPASEPTADRDPPRRISQCAPHRETIEVEVAGRPVWQR